MTPSPHTLEAFKSVLKTCLFHQVSLLFVFISGVGVGSWWNWWFPLPHCVWVFIFIIYCFLHVKLTRIVDDLEMSGRQAGS